MKKNAELKIRILFLALCLCSLTAFVYASEPKAPSREAAEGPHVPSISAANFKDAEDGILPPKAATSAVDSMEFLRSGSKKDPETQTVFAASPMPDGQGTFNDRSAQKEAPSAFAKEPGKQEVSALVDDVLSRMVDAGLEKDLSKALTYINKGDYSGLVDFQKNNPEILSEFISSIEKSSETSPKNTFSTDDAKHWLEDARRVQEDLLKLQPGVDSSPDPLIKAVAKLYKPIAKRISEVAESLEKETGASENLGDKDPSSGDLLKDFSDKAKEFILNSFNRAQTNLANGMLSNPLETTAFAAEATPAIMSGDAVATREWTVAELYTKSQNKKYQSVDSVYVGKDFIYAQKMLHPPANLHPYLKWLLYTRNLTPRMVENYLATREAVGAIYERAKEGQGNIRYRGKVYGAFLPFAETAAGNYELVKPASGE